MNNRLEHEWFDSMVWFQQWLRYFSMERDVARMDSETCLPSMSVPFTSVFHFGDEKSNRNCISSAYDFRLT